MRFPLGSATQDVLGFQCTSYGGLTSVAPASSARLCAASSGLRLPESQAVALLLAAEFTNGHQVGSDLLEAQLLRYRH